MWVLVSNTIDKEHIRKAIIVMLALASTYNVMKS